MSNVEIDLARDYLAATQHDPIAALIWAVKDLARARRTASSSNQEASPAITAEYTLASHDRRIEGVATTLELA